MNDAEHVAGDWHMLVTVQVTVLLPPQALGAVPPSLLIDVMHPPLNVALFNHAA